MLGLTAILNSSNTNCQSAPIALVSVNSPNAPEISKLSYRLSCPIAGYSAKLSGT